MPKFDIAVVATVECSSIKEAREIIYELLYDSDGAVDKSKLSSPHNIELNMANDLTKTKTGERVFFLHPEKIDLETYETQEFLIEDK